MATTDSRSTDSDPQIGDNPTNFHANISRRVSFSSNVSTARSQKREREAHFARKISTFQTNAQATDEGEEADPTRKQKSDPWAQKNIVTFDGGGILGYSSLLILGRLMELIGEEESSTAPSAKSSAYPYPLPEDENDHRMSKQDHIVKVKRAWTFSQEKPSPTPIHASRFSEYEVTDMVLRKEQYLPCHYFDYVGGTSTGGLIAIMLGRLGMSVQECTDQYVDLDAKIFHTNQRFRIPPPFKYGAMRKNTERLRALFQDMMESRREDRKTRKTERFASNSPRCRTIVTTVRQNDSSSVLCLLRSYNPSIIADPFEEKPGPPLNCTIQQAAMATTAAPTYFKPIEIQGKKFIDAALAENNPNLLILQEVERRHSYQNPIDVFLSIGTGVSAEFPFPRFPSMQFIRGLNKTLRMLIFREDDFPMEEALTRCSHQQIMYARWNIPLSNTGLEKLGKTGEHKLWRYSRPSLEIIRAATQSYLHTPELEASLRAVARKLVVRRRLRSKTPQWESFVFGRAYVCREDGCPDGQKTKFRNRNELIGHMQRVHLLSSPGPDNVEKIEEILEKCKIEFDGDFGS